MLSQAFQTASKTMKIRTQKAYYDRRARANADREGDQVLWLSSGQV